MAGGDGGWRLGRSTAAAVGGSDRATGSPTNAGRFLSRAKGGTCLRSCSAAAAAPLDDQQKRGCVDHIDRPHARARIDVDRRGPAGGVVVDSVLGYCRRRWWVAAWSIDGCGCRRLGSSYGVTDKRRPISQQGQGGHLSPLVQRGGSRAPGRSAEKGVR